MNYNLNNRIALWDKVEVENEIEEITHEFKEIKYIWADILPISGSNKENSSEIKIKIVVRRLSLKNINNSMYFIYKNERFDVDYFIPRFDNPDFIEIYCKLVIE